jgi:hypothetical protein
MTRSVFIAIPKKVGALECENHRTISLMSHVTKILLRIILNRWQGKIGKEISDVQCGFVKDKGTANAIFIIRNIIERTLEVNKDVYACFIDYTKAFDKVRHKEMINILKKLNFDGKDVRLIGNLYWDQTAAIKVKNEVSEWKQIRRGIRQGCVMSPVLFSLYSENILRDIENIGGIVVEGRNINNVRFADDTVFLAETEKELQEILDVGVSGSEEKGLDLNSKKTISVVFTRKTNIPQCQLQVKGEKIKQEDRFIYLGGELTSNGKCKQEVNRRMGIAKTTSTS